MKCCYNYITKIQYRNSAFRLYLYKLIDKCAVVNAGYNKKPEGSKCCEQ